jgi:hypothetical protein
LRLHSSPERRLLLQNVTHLAARMQLNLELRPPCPGIGTSDVASIRTRLSHLWQGDPAAGGRDVCDQPSADFGCRDPHIPSAKAPAPSGADSWLTAGVSRASAQVVGSSGNDWIAAYAMVPGQRDVTDASVVVNGGGGDNRISALFTDMLSVDAFSGDDVIDAHFDSDGVVSAGEGNDLVYMTGSLGTADGGAGNDISCWQVRPSAARRSGNPRRHRPDAGGCRDYRLHHDSELSAGTCDVRVQQQCSR